MSKQFSRSYKKRVRSPARLTYAFGVPCTTVFFVKYFTVKSLKFIDMEYAQMFH